MLIMESAFKDKYLLTAPMLVRIELRVGRPFHKRNILPLMLVKRHNSQPVYQARMPRLAVGVNGKLLLIVIAELVKFHKNRRAFGADHWLMSGAYGIADIGASRIFPVFVPKHTIKHKDFLAT